MNGALVFETDEPVQTETVDDLPVGGAPWPLLQVVYDLAAFAEPGEPGAQRFRASRAQQRQHHALGPERWLVPGHIGAEQRDRPAGEIAMRDGIRRTVRPAELPEGMQLHGAAEHVAVEHQ